MAIVLVGCKKQTIDESLAEVSLDSDTFISKTVVETPMHPLSIPELRKRDFKLEAFTLLDEVPAKAGLYAQEFRYVSDGAINYGLIERPAGAIPKEGWPVIVVAHGYIPPANYSTTVNYRLVTQYYAAGGFLVVKPDYRGHGRSEGHNSESPSRTIDYTIDVLHLLSGLDSIDGADMDNIFLYGHSMGGEIGLRILTVSTQLKAATLWAAVTQDFPENTLYFIRKRNNLDAEILQKHIDAEFTTEQFASISPNTYLDSISVPIVIHHGTRDESVPFEWSLLFRQRLDSAGVRYRFFEYPTEDHNISKSFYQVMDTDMEFFRSLM